MSLPAEPTPPPAPESGPLHPVTVGDRSPLPDVLRGLALLGILVVNVQDFAGFREWTQTGVDRAVQVLTDIFFNGRSISLFAMLFGWGAAGLLTRHGSGLLTRRLLVLLGLGTLHGVLVWHGDIISNYAPLALVLLVTVRLSMRALLGLAGVLGGYWLVSGVMLALVYWTSPRVRTPGLPDLAPGMTYVEVVGGRAATFLDDLIGGSLYNGPWLIALFLLGAAAQRSGLLTRPHEHRPLLRRMMVWGLGLGLPLGALLAWLNTQSGLAAGLIAIPVRMGGGIASALGYVGVLGLLAARDRLGPLRAFAASGRVALTNYVLQSLVMTTVFYPYAGAQFGRWGAAPAVVLALGVALAQLPLSGWMLRTWGTGPLERLVRTLVYARRRQRTN
ncbi:DUF418 domain-containing protein [Deinococcus sp. MIMF12]|uniref:DUF418 domain-containing protein n=1 Tax=Deinococcus rhizophilus TaxID=3049544 RepID=A0ABT7JP31_9DEIO|nr:DUF418 domain-containing protein [Deinococcus rhizophilus]MDL2345409.1 DUF418 domain-containing protein [Deinococcus rhizophilus]